MKLWSKGLGKLILPFYINEAESVEEESDCIVIKGRIIEKKVNWPYIIRLYPDDMVNFTRLMAYNPVVLSYMKKRLGIKLLLFLIPKLAYAFIITPFVFVEKVLRWIKSKIPFFKSGKIGVSEISQNPENSGAERNPEKPKENIEGDGKLKDEGGEN